MAVVLAQIKLPKKEKESTMDLKLKDAAELLKVSEKTLYRWVEGDKIPFYRINRQFRFKTEEVEAWAKNRKPHAVDDSASGNARHPINIIELLSRSGIHYRIEGDNPETLIRNSMKIIPVPPGIDKESITQLLVSREIMMPTSIGKGIAVPHPRHPELPSINLEFLAICFPEKPFDFGSLDGEPVHTIIILVCANTSRHLRALSEISLLCQKRNVHYLLKNRALREDIYKVMGEERNKIK